MFDADIAGQKREVRLQVIAFSGEVDTGSREENASNKRLDPGSDSIRPERLWMTRQSII
jgi:hypothetical protein